MNERIYVCHTSVSYTHLDVYKRQEELMYSLSIYAAQNNMTVNYFNYSCQTIRSLAAEHLQEEMNNVQADTLYIYKAAEEDKCFNPKMEYVEVDGVIVGKVK